MSVLTYLVTYLLMPIMSYYVSHGMAFSKGRMRRKLGSWSSWTSWSVLNVEKKIGPFLGSSIRPNLVLIRPCLSHSIDCCLTHLFLGRTSHAWLHTRGVTIRMGAHEWIFTTRMAALKLYHSRLNVRYRDYVCDRGIRNSAIWRTSWLLLNNNNNTLIYIAPACRMTSEALADSSSRATECLTEK